MREHEMISILEASHLDYPKNDPEPQTMLDANFEADAKKVALDQVIPGTGFKLKGLHGIWNSSWMMLWIYPHVTEIPETPASQSRRVEINFTVRDIKRWKMAWRAVQMCIAKSNSPEVRYENYNGIPRPMFLFRRHQDWPDIDDVFNNQTIVFGFSAAGFIYGGLHALAWSAHFHSLIEQFMWQISACIVMGCFPVTLIGNHFWDYLVDMRYLPGWKNHMRDISIVLLTILLYLLVFTYMVARAYLVVECFINLSQLPASVYDMPNWSAYFPHIA